MVIKDRIKSFRRIKASQLIPNSRNWRTHPAVQETALRTILNEIGFAAACLVRDCGDGTYELIDGHLRANIAEDAQIPCLISDLTASEADQVLATFDSITSLAETDQSALNALLESITTESEDLQELLQNLKSSSPELPEQESGVDEIELLTERFSVLVDCKAEAEQLALLDYLKSAGYQCRAWIS
ncbi:ParB N-terminal domain-containing protein [Gimesia chilikensis]|uniref:ParB N-terminal domain-containing protein n=1 Tax=Gimesia chilikensis TaxID=2605989 RepID=UPI003A901764